ncbi:MAG: ATP-binding cassette domain-containing protein [Gemmatimonadetes bacterium]|nr:ATP-binding cassette domain-containing protein [Gemmatimonadota bacterium]
MSSLESEDTVVRLSGATYSVNGKKLVGPLDFSVLHGETVVLLGESGSGKTTTLRLINALIYPTEGTVFVEGRDSREWDPVELRRRTGYVIQETGLLPHFTVGQNVGLVPKLKAWDTSRTSARIDEMLELVDLPVDEYRDRYPHELSGGQRQRVGVARALAADPPLLLCDEPFGAVDPATRRALQREFASLTRRLQKTVVFVTHDVREARLLGDRILVIDRGLVSFDGSIQEFADSDDNAVRELRGEPWSS